MLDDTAAALGETHIGTDLQTARMYIENPECGRNSSKNLFDRKIGFAIALYCNIKW